MKRILIAIMILMSMNAYAIRLSEIMAAISCNSVPDNEFFFQELKKDYGEPRIENGAAWFTASGDMYGSPVKEIFVSVTEYKFIGVIIDGKPDVVIKNIPTSTQYPANVFPSGSMWVGSDGREIVWHAGKYTKIFCNKGSR